MRSEQFEADVPCQRKTPTTRVAEENKVPLSGDAKEWKPIEKKRGRPSTKKVSTTNV
jgi:hypothetical protein